METPQAKMFVRSLNNSTAKILMAFILARAALDVQELREWTGMKRETIYDGLNSLKALGKVDKQVLAHGRTMWLPSGDMLPGFLQLSAKRTPELPQESEKGTSELQESGIWTPALVVGGVSINLNESDSLNPPNSQESEKRTSDLPEGKPAFPSVVDILSLTDLLFDGSLVMSKGLESCSPIDALCWCAYAYSQKDKMNAPGGVVRNRLKENQSPPAWVKHRWQQILPDDFLEALGLVTYECPVVGCGQGFDQRAKLEEHKKADHPLPHLCEYCMEQFANRELLQVHIDEAHTEQPVAPCATDESALVPIEGRMSAAQAWESVLDQLQQDMPRQSFETWVRDSKAVRFDGNTLSVGVHNGYARDWLESRIRSTVERLLVGILARRVRVMFVVAHAQRAEVDHD